MSHLTTVWIDFKEYFKKLELKGLKLLDVGCRDDTSKVFFENLGMVWYGVDLAPKTMNVLHDDMSVLSCFEEESFDILFVCHSFEHCERPVDSLKRFLKLLKPNGYLFLALPCHCYDHIATTDRDHIFVLDNIQMRRLLGYCGFQEIRCYNGEWIDDSPHQFSLICIGKKWGRKSF